MGEVLHEQDMIQQYSSFLSLTSEQLDNIPEIDDMVEAGFEFTGDELDDTFHCATCDLRLAHWKETDDPWKEHANYSPQCAYLRKEKTQDYIDSVQAEFMTNTNMYTPRNPKYSKLTARETTYTNPNWPVQVRMRPEELAKAGFFYTGEGATVRCYYCDIDLNGLEPHAEPWANHALNSPRCMYLIKMKGIDFVENFKATKDIDLPVSPVSLDPSNPVSILTSMGFSKKVIREAAEQYASNNDGAHNYRVGDLLWLIQNTDGGDEEVEDQHDMPSYAEQEKLNQRMLCRICNKQPITSVLLPCLHLYLCEGCADGRAICPSCNKKTTPFSSRLSVGDSDYLNT